jgi:DNA-binding IclR family transcriptional regulator
MEENNLSSIEKAILILEQLSKQPYSHKIIELSKALSLNRSSVYRILKTLERYDLVSVDNQAGFRIGPGMFHIGSSYLHKNTYLNKINDILVEISEKTKESVGMAMKDADKIISVFEVEVHQPMKLNDLPGRYFPPNKGCYGKCITAYRPSDEINRLLDKSKFEKTLPNTLTTKEELLAEYAKIRQQGYCTSIDEQGIDILAVGIPVFDSRGAIAACVAVAFFRRDGWEKALEEARDLLLSYKDRLNRLIP